MFVMQRTTSIKNRGLDYSKEVLMLMAWHSDVRRGLT